MKQESNSFYLLKEERIAGKTRQKIDLATPF